jgi:solute carrier family 40 (iron-regulated transporter), member 1
MCHLKVRRIDLLCKLLGPLVISSIAAASTIIAIWATLGMNIVSVVFEYVFIAQVSVLAIEQSLVLIC